MPSLFRVGSYLVYFWSNENNEPIHVHIAKGKPHKNATKIWLTSSGGCVVAHNKTKIPASVLNQILEVISAQYFMIIDEWKSHFKLTKVDFYC